MVAWLLQWFIADEPAMPSTWLDNSAWVWGGGGVTGLFLIVVVVWLTGSKKKGHTEVDANRKHEKRAD